MIEPKQNVKDMEEYIPPLEGRRGLLRLDFNENTIGPSPKVVEAVRSMTDEELAAYPEYSKFKKRLAKYLDINDSNLLLTNATDEAINVVMQTYVEKGDEVIIPSPSFAMFKFYSQAADAKITEVLYTKTLNFPTKKVFSKINKKTKIIILCNPNNPTGTSIERSDIEKIAEKAKNSIILIDEAYNQFSKQNSIPLTQKYDNIIVIQTFSKALGIGGLRLGYIVSNKENIKNIAKVLSPYSVNSAALRAGTEALKDKDYIEWYTKEVSIAKKYIFNEFKKLKIKTYPTTANFFLAKFKNPKVMAKKLREKGILVRDLSDYPLLKGCIRITIGTKQQMQELIKAIKEVK